MADRNAENLGHSALNAFLYAEAGTDFNGSTVTMLSVLARMDKDPWEEAGRLARMPKTALPENLARLIGRTPLSSVSSADARARAARLVLLLPGPAGALQSPGIVAVDITTRQSYGPLILIFCALALGTSMSLLFTQQQAGSITAMTHQSPKQATPPSPQLSR
ncbi:hypothetical protein [Acidisoma cladoniae]|uniref:hypothetical protein n=1 Tax=Acidisoma cladoniae TaxID=3040935 RepID=UPI00254DD95E|nr:hypothetical protein [Acidisoma sp. PAMC 29798]